jgi:hypothetical protein
VLLPTDDVVGWMASVLEKHAIWNQAIMRAPTLVCFSNNELGIAL